MKLFTFATSPYARKAQMALDYKGIAYESCERCYSLDRKEDLREVNVRAEVPTLVLDDGRVITDSTIICEYLEDAFPTPPLFPTDAFERARMRHIEDLCDRSFDATVFGYFLGVVRAEAPESAVIKKAAAAEFGSLLKQLDGELAERDFFCGKVSVADLAAICHVPIRESDWPRHRRYAPARAMDPQDVRNPRRGRRSPTRRESGSEDEEHDR